MLSDIKIEKKKRQRENEEVKNAIKKWLDQNIEPGKFVYYKNWGGGIYSKSGRPDIEITYRGLVNYWELKDEDGILSPLQKEVIKSYARADKEIYIANSLQEFIETWQKIYNKKY